LDAIGSIDDGPVLSAFGLNSLTCLKSILFSVVIHVSGERMPTSDLDQGAEVILPM